MARYRIINAVTAGFIDVFQTTSIISSTATSIVVTNTDGTVTTIAGSGFTFAGNVATAGTVTSITRTTTVGGTQLDIADQLSAANNSLVSFWNAPDPIARFNYATSQGDQAFGSGGVDNINLGIGDNDFTGYGGNDTFTGNIGFDFLSYAAESSANTPGTQGVVVNLSSASVTATITGGTFTVAAGTAKDSYGFTDTFTSMEGASGTVFNDALYGNTSNNVFRPYGGNDFVDGGAGFDEYSAVSANASNALFIPTTGITVTYTAGTSFDGTVSVDGYGGSDTFTSIERIRGTNLTDIINGNDANNSLRGLGGNDTFNGGAGLDEADYSRDVDYGGTNGVIVNLSGAAISATIAAGGPFNVGAGQARDGFGATDTLNSVENIIGTAQGDYIVGSVWDNNINGSGGNDTIIGGLGFDFITPGSGADIIDGTAPGPSPGSGDQSYADRQEIFYGDNNNGVGVAVNFSNVAVNNISVGGVVGTFSLAALTGRDWSGSIDTYIDIERVRGTASADYFRGSDTANLRQERFNGGGGADIIDGGAGTDQVRYNNDGGTAGVIVNLSTSSVNATISTGNFTVLAGQARDGTGATDTLISIEQVIGTNNSDYLVGSDGRNNFRMLGGNDTVDGGAGNDIVTLYVDDTFNAPGGTIDLAAGTATGIAGGISVLISIEDAEGSEGNDTLIGSIGDNSLYGGAGDDVISGGDGDDLINGSSGNNTLSGGIGDDILSYMEDPGYGEYLNRQFSNFFPTPWAGVTVSLLSGTATHHAGGTDTLSGFENVVGTFFNDNITGDAGDNGFDGLSGNDVINGGGGSDSVYYGTFDNNGRTTVLLPGINGSDPNGVTVNLLTGTANDGEGGTDTLISIENVIGSRGVDTITGDGNNNRLQGGAGGDTLIGGGGIDTASYENSQSGVTVTVNGAASGGDAQGDTLSGFENLRGSFNDDTLTGDGGSNSLEGFEGNDTLDGGAGGDFLDGGSGGDTYFVDDAGDQVVESLGIGTDVVNTSLASYTLTANVENLNAIGAAASHTFTGNADNNVINTSVGNFADVIVGGAGADTMLGFDGGDTYLVDNSGDFIIEGGGVDSGYDVVFSTAVSYTMSANLEQLVLQGGAVTGIGNEGVNFLYGGLSGLSLTLDGAGGDDVIFAGLAGGNTLIGGSGVDTLLVYGGNNNANGGLGSDVYFTYTSTDVLSELGGDGIDTVYATYTINVGEDIEQVLVSGASGGATSTSLDDNNIFYGNSASGPVTLSGGGGADVLIAGTFGDTLIGGAGVDLLFGYGGANNLQGGDDTDVYYLESGLDTVTETLTGGFDTIYSQNAGTTTIATNVEQLILYGAANGGLGNGDANYIYGSSASQAVTLDGAGGNDYLRDSAFSGDVLIGGIGSDQLDLRSLGNDFIKYATAGSGADFVFGFDADPVGGQDQIDVSGRGFNAGSIGGAITIVASGADTIVNIGADSIRLFGVVSTDVDATDFKFV